ncbi:MAG: PQQ-binding-like beta-propeller repeat protein [Planctomycetes bacterium]|nr:PQQ-binding-like beta-propeller repeat protein [Planctomycetota bacterium]
MTKGNCIWALALVVLALSACASDENDAGMRSMDDTSMAADLSHIDPVIARKRELEGEALGIADAVAWSFKTGMGETFRRVWENGRWLLAETYNAHSKNYSVRSIDLVEGREQWVLVLGEHPLARAPHVGDGTIAFLTDIDGAMIVVNAVTGGRLYAFRSDLDVVPSGDATSKGDTVYVPNHVSQRIAAVAAEDGRNGWDFRIRGFCNTAPVLTYGQSQQFLIVGTDAGELTALRAKRHNEVPPERAEWSRTLDTGAVTADPRFIMVPTGDEGMARGLVVVPTEGGWLYGIEPSTGRSHWVLRSDKGFGCSPKFMNGRIYARNAERLFCLDAMSGDRAWMPAGSESLSEYERSQLFREPVGYELADRALAADDNRVYLLKGKNTVLRCGNDGSIETELDLPSFDFFISNEATGKLVLLTADGYVVACQ